MTAPIAIETASTSRCPRCDKVPDIASAHDCLECSMKLLDRLLPTMGEPAMVVSFPPRARAG